MADNQQQVSEAELKAQATVAGQRLGFLIFNLFRVGEEQDQMLAVTEKMSPEQLLEFTGILEEKYQEIASQAAEINLRARLQVAKDGYIQKQEDINQNTLDELAALEQEIDTAAN